MTPPQCQYFGATWVRELDAQIGSYEQFAGRLVLHLRPPKVAMNLCLLVRRNFSAAKSLRLVSKWLFVLVLSSLSCLCLPTALHAAGEDPNTLIVAVEDSKLSQELHMPLYEWYPKDKPPTGMLLAVHGLTLHGKRYEILGKAFAAGGFYACAFDMRGFGRCYADAQHKYCVGDDCKRKVDYEKSYADIVSLATRLKENHPKLPLFLMGESLGTSVCIKLAAEHPELADALILSGPTAKINPRMMLQPKNFAAGCYALLIQPRFNMSTRAFVKGLVSNDKNIVAEMLDDPMCRKGLTIAELMKTDEFVSKTLKYARKIKRNEPVLILQGSLDRCMVPDGVIKLCKSIPSSDQTLRWLNSHGHLLLETDYLRPATVDAVSNFIEDHQPAHEAEAKLIQKDILKLGAKPCTDED